MSHINLLYIFTQSFHLWYVLFLSELLFHLPLSCSIPCRFGRCSQSLSFFSKSSLISEPEVDGNIQILFRIRMGRHLMMPISRQIQNITRSEADFVGSGLLQQRMTVKVWIIKVDGWPGKKGRDEKMNESNATAQEQPAHANHSNEEIKVTYPKTTLTSVLVRIRLLKIPG